MTLMEIEENFTKTVPSCNDCAAKIVRTRNPRTRKGVRMTCPAFPKKNKSVISPDSRIRRGLGRSTQTVFYKILASWRCAELNSINI